MSAVPADGQKTYKTFEEQLAIIEERGLQVTNRDQALLDLRRLGYYRLSAYWYPFRIRVPEHVEGTDIPSNMVNPGHRFEDIVALCDFDGAFRIAIMTAIEVIEVATRVAIAYVLGEYGALGYLDKENLGNGALKPCQIDPTMTEFDFVCDRMRRSVQSSREDFAKHHRIAYNSEVPVWVAIELWDFGTMSRFSQMMTPADRGKVATLLGLPGTRALGSLIQGLNDVRNLCAHHCRLNRRHFPNSPRIPDARAVPSLHHVQKINTKHKNRLYPHLCIMSYFLALQGKELSWRERMINLFHEIERLPSLKIDDYGIPHDWASQEIWSTMSSDQLS